MNKSFIFYTLLFSIIFSSNVFAGSEPITNIANVANEDNSENVNIVVADETRDEPLEVPCYFRGNSSGEDLYTVGWITGKSSYTITINNHNHNERTLNFTISIIKEESPFEISNFESPEFSEFCKVNVDVNPSDLIYLKFNGESSFSGHIF